MAVQGNCCFSAADSLIINASLGSSSAASPSTHATTLTKLGSRHARLSSCHRAAAFRYAKFCSRRYFSPISTSPVSGSFLSASKKAGFYGERQVAVRSHSLFLRHKPLSSKACRALQEGSSHQDTPGLHSQEASNLELLPKDLPPKLATSKGHEQFVAHSHRNRGRSGVVVFYAPEKDQVADSEVTDDVGRSSSWWSSFLWVLGPTVLVSCVVLPPFLLRKVFEAVLEDSLVTDFLILFFTEAFFYVGVSIFLYVAHKVQFSLGVSTWRFGDFPSLGYRLSSIVTMIFAVLLPLGAFGLVWPWTGPAAAAALFPYMASLLMQYAFEQFVQEKKSSVWPLIPILFQVYRLHQLNRATQLVAGLLYSLRGAEATAEALAVNGSLQTLVSVLQLLGMLCLWSLGAFLTHIFTFESGAAQQRRLKAT